MIAQPHNASHIHFSDRYSRILSLEADRHQKILSGLLDGINAQAREYQHSAASTAVQMFSGKSTSDRGILLGPVGSVLIESPANSGKAVMGLMIARQLQFQFGLSVAWAAGSQRLMEVCAENDSRGFDVDFTPVELSSRKEAKADLLVVDRDVLHDVDRLMQLHELVEPQIVLGLAESPFTNKAVRDCFDQRIEAISASKLACWKKETVEFLVQSLVELVSGDAM